VKEITKETVRAAVRKAAKMPRKKDFTPSRVSSVLAAAVATFDVSPKYFGADRRNGEPGPNQIQIGRVCRGLDFNRQ
jgi:hypothetical protein